MRVVIVVSEGESYGLLGGGWSQDPSCRRNLRFALVSKNG